MADKWNIIIVRGMTYQTTVTVTSGIPDIATASNWRLEAAMPNEAPFLTATVSNGYFAAGINSAQKILTVPATASANFPTGNGRFTFSIEWADGRKIPYYVGIIAVNPNIGQVTP